MLEKPIYYFEKSGPENTEQVIEIVRKRITDLNLNHLVVATTTGKTGVMFAKAFRGTDLKVIAVTHQYGLRGPGIIILTDENKTKMRELGVPVVIGADILTTPHRAFRGKLGGSPFDIVADTLRMFCEGMKVCVEIAVMAADVGLVPIDQDIMTVAGTGRGADTVVVLRPVNGNYLFDLHIKEIVAMPMMRAKQRT
jgi:hypothetical protein